MNYNPNDEPNRDKSTLLSENGKTELNKIPLALPTNPNSKITPDEEPIPEIKDPELVPFVDVSTDELNLLKHAYVNPEDAVITEIEDTGKEFLKQPEPKDKYGISRNDETNSENNNTPNSDKGGPDHGEYTLDGF